MGYLYYSNEKKEIKANARKELTAIAELKVREINGWRNERFEDAKTILNNPLFADFVRQFLHGHVSTNTRNTIYSWLKSFQTSPQYKNILLIDAKGNVRLSVDKKVMAIDKHHRVMIELALRKNAVTFVDFHIDERDNAVSLDILVPISAAYGNKTHTVGVVMMCIEPDVRLYPMIQSWPIPTSSGETLLVRREGDDVVFLNELRHKKDTQLILRRPLSEEQLPAAMAARSKEGIVEGRDYRGADVLAAIKAVPNSPWFLIAKVDTDEMNAPVRERFWIAFIFVSALIILAGTMTGYIWRYRQTRIYQTANEALQAEIRERKQAEKLLEERTIQLEAANKELESFCYSVSHDLRNPLRAIDGYSRTILKNQGDKFDEDTRSRFNRIRRNTQMMGELIDDLLSFSRLGRAEINMSDLDMEDLVCEVWKELQVINPNRQLNLTNNNVPPGRGDRTLIKQVYANLLSNAVKFTKNVKDAYIEAGGYSEGNENVYYVKDNGVGFDMNYYDKLFGVFQRLHSDDDFEGTGIGLAIVQRIIQRHEGRVWAEGKVNQGAVFYFSLPKVEPTNVDA